MCQERVTDFFLFFLQISVILFIMIHTVHSLVVDGSAVKQIIATPNTKQFC